MTEPHYKKALLAFGNYQPDLPGTEHGFEEFSVIPLSGGLINDTYKIESPSGNTFILQRINQHVFPQPEEVQENYIHLSDYAASGSAGFKMPKPMYYSQTGSLFKDDNGNSWRAFEFVNDSIAVPVANTPSQAGETAATFAKFTKAFSGFDTCLLHEVIPGFHNLSLRYRQFETSLSTALPERMDRSAGLCAELKNRERYKFFYEEIKTSDEYPLRVMHHDAKIANILFNNRSGEVICPVDFDTTMPGYFFSDLGDMIRSMAGSAGENETDLRQVTIRTDIYKAVIEGYLSHLADKFTVVERNHIHHAGLLITYMQALRFLTDFLGGDTYYKIDYPHHNLRRAENQLALLKSLEEFLKLEYHYES